MDVTKYRIEALFTSEGNSSNDAIKKLYLADEDSKFVITISQSKSLRTVAVDFNIFGEYNEAFTALFQTEKLLQLFDGHFCKLESIVSQAEDINDPQLVEIDAKAKAYMNNRLSYYSSRDFTLYSFNKLVFFEQVIDDSILIKWQDLLLELDIAHQIFLYASSMNAIPTDMFVAFLIELAEPLFELVKVKKNRFNSSKNRTTLRNCIDEIIKEYGAIIFRNELKNDYDSTLDKLVNSRVRIMHIKSKQAREYFSNKECIYYSAKMQLLYRVVLFDLLGIDKVLYIDRLENCVNHWERWYAYKQNKLVDT